MACAILALVGCSGKAPPPEVKAAGEVLRGVWTGEEHKAAAFLGIPFAAPPVGDLRWRAPVKPSPRSGQQEASAFAPACVQGTYMVDWYAQVAAAFGAGPEVAARPQNTSEDCLYLNIWTPDLRADAGLPVMVYVHGGSNKGGWAFEPNYVGDRLAARGVVVVSIAYRLGPLGFFSHPALDNGPRGPVANFGLLDIDQAFRWVRANIAAFGGNPRNITGFGESAGAANLLILALSDANEDGLFRRLIAQGAGPFLSNLETLPNEQEMGRRLIAALGSADELNTTELRAIPAEKLVEAADRAFPGHYFSPVIDNLTLHQQPMDVLRGGRGHWLDLIIGTSADEYYMYVDPSTGPDDVGQWIKETAPEFAGSLMAQVADEPDSRAALDRLQTARDMLCPSRYAAGLVSSQGGQAYVYYFSRRRSGDGGAALGAYHGAELPYVFMQHDDWLPTDQTDRDLSDAVMEYWTSFAQNGNPVSANHPGWPIYTADRQYVMELGDQVRIAEPGDEALCQYLGSREK